MNTLSSPTPPRPMNGLRLVAFITGSLLEFIGALSISQVHGLVSLTAMILGFVIVLLAVGERSLLNPYASWFEGLSVVAVCALGVGLLHYATSIPSLSHLTPSPFGSILAWCIAVSHVKSYLRYRRWNLKAEQVVAPSRSLAPTLNSTSSVRGSEDS
jgi:hypothetical protein